jgi:hypothetical protein
MTAAVWLALASAVAVLIGQWGTGRLFARLKAIEDRLEAIDRHLTATDGKLETVNAEGSDRGDKVQVMYWDLKERLGEAKERIKVLETIVDRRKDETRRDGELWQRS